MLAVVARMGGLGMSARVMLGMRMFGQQVQRSSPRPTIVDVGGLELSMRARLVSGTVPLLHGPYPGFVFVRLCGISADCHPVDHELAHIAR
ncbi:hypothetical protein GCM10010198_06640 [Nocardia seriolae]|nr:hypothetical protein NSERKGN1266_19210 [Nocardia seriolae]BEK98092.1 hypothetical protein NSER024013_59980 [Nocardia seriolae]GEM27099.1 hypothetical protein NS2_53380 [Nocardia seriolae NBRC 15557]